MSGSSNGGGGASGASGASGSGGSSFAAEMQQIQQTSDAHSIITAKTNEHINDNNQMAQAASQVNR
jgi:hypothetical protein